MYKLTILFHKPTTLEDEQSCEAVWTFDFIPYVEKMPELKRIEVSLIQGTPDGVSEFYKMHEFYFETRAAMDRALNSDAGMRAGYALQKFPKGSYKLLFSDVMEMIMPMNNETMNNETMNNETMKNEQ